jgi:hypothetical protein
MIASMTLVESSIEADDTVTDDGATEKRRPGVSAARHRSWKNRGRSQVIFNGPPVTSPSDADAAVYCKSTSGKTERTAVRQTSLVPAPA